jgi:glycosyltransferase involved in cell wall biosynthesis
VDARELQGRPTGTGRYLRSLLRVWLRGGEDRFTLYFNGPAPSDPVLDHPRIAIRPIGESPVRGILWQELRLPGAARADRLDVFFAPAYACPLRLDVPRVTTVHDLSFFSWPEDFAVIDAARRRLLVAVSIGASARIIAVSDFTRREILGRFPGARERVQIIPEGPPDDLPPAPSREAARERLGVRGPLVLSVGSILNRRRLPVLLEAMRRLAQGATPATLHVVGDNRTTPLFDIPARVRRLDLEARVQVSGFVPESALADRYAAADAFVFLSEYEGFGLPVLEAMTRGVPVVTSMRPATGEIFGEAALVVDPSDPAAVAAALDRALQDNALRADLVARGHALSARFSWATAAERTLTLLREAAAS